MIRVCAGRNVRATQNQSKGHRADCVECFLAGLKASASTGTARSKTIRAVGVLRLRTRLLRASFAQDDNSLRVGCPRHTNQKRKLHIDWNPVLAKLGRGTPTPRISRKIERPYFVFSRNSLSFFRLRTAIQRVMESMLSLFPIRKAVKQRARTEWSSEAPKYCQSGAFAPG
jgi:hypothetical protein